MVIVVAWGVVAWGVVACGVACGVVACGVVVVAGNLVQPVVVDDVEDIDQLIDVEVVARAVRNGRRDVVDRRVVRRLAKLPPRRGTGRGDCELPTIIRLCVLDDLLEWNADEERELEVPDRRRQRAAVARAEAARPAEASPADDRLERGLHIVDQSRDGAVAHLERESPLNEVLDLVDQWGRRVLGVHQNVLELDGANALGHSPGQLLLLLDRVTEGERVVVGPLLQPLLGRVGADVEGEFETLPHHRLAVAVTQDGGAEKRVDRVDDDVEEGLRRRLLIVRRVVDEIEGRVHGVLECRAGDVDRARARESLLDQRQRDAPVVLDPCCGARVTTEQLVDSAVSLVLQVLCEVGCAQANFILERRPSTGHVDGLFAVPNVPRLMCETARHHTGCGVAGDREERLLELALVDHAPDVGKRWSGAHTLHDRVDHRVVDPLRHKHAKEPASTDSFGGGGNLEHAAAALDDVGGNGVRREVRDARRQQTVERKRRGGRKRDERDHFPPAVPGTPV